MARKTPTPEAPPPVIDWAGLDWLVRTRLPEQLDTLGFPEQAALARALPPIVDHLTADLARRLDSALRMPIIVDSMSASDAIAAMPDTTEDEHTAKLRARDAYARDARRLTSMAAITHATLACGSASDLPDPPRHTLEYIARAVRTAVESERLRPLRGGGL